MSTASGLTTAADLLRMGPGRRELIRGELREMPPSGGEHGERAAEVLFVIKDFVRKAGLAGKVYGAETGFLVHQDPDTVRGADVAYMSLARLEGGASPKGFIVGGPDLAVEVMSPGDRVSEVEEKVDEYLAAGTRLVWVLNSHRKTVTVYRPSSEPQLLTSLETLGGGDVLPGFAIKVEELFRS